VVKLTFLRACAFELKSFGKHFEISSLSPYTEDCNVTQIIPINQLDCKILKAKHKTTAIDAKQPHKSKDRNGDHRTK
jgi:hypothetical protein